MLPSFIGNYHPFQRYASIIQDAHQINNIFRGRGYIISLAFQLFSTSRKRQVKERLDGYLLSLFPGIWKVWKSYEGANRVHTYAIDLIYSVGARYFSSFSTFTSCLSSIFSLGSYVLTRSWTCVKALAGFQNRWSLRSGFSMNGSWCKSNTSTNDRLPGRKWEWGRGCLIERGGF